MNIKEDKLCSYRGKNDENILHLFYHCDLTKFLWRRLRTNFSTLPELAPHSAIVVFMQIATLGAHTMRLLCALRVSMCSTMLLGG